MAIKTYTKREDVPQKYKWDLEYVLKGKTIENLFKDYEKLRKELISEKDNKYQDEETFLKQLKKEDKVTLISYQIHSFIGNGLQENLVDPQKKKLINDFDFLVYNLDVEQGPELPAIFANAKNIQTWIQKPAFKNYKIYFERILETKKHQLPKAIQEFRNKESRADISSEEIFEIITDSEMDFGFVLDSKDKKHKLTQGNYSKILEKKDKTLRKNAFNRFNKTFLKNKNSLANMLYQHFKKETVWAKLTNHKSIIDYLVYDDRSNEKVLLSLYKSVQENLKVFKNFRNLTKKIYKKKFKEKMEKYDFNVPLLNVKTDYSIEEAQKIVLDALKPFGNEYLEQAKKAIAERWVDYIETPGKLSGAYSNGMHGVEKKYILMNFEGTLRSVETLIHELGHSMHSYYSEKANHVRNSQYRIFVAEIASIFNELILFDYLLKETKDDKLKFKIRQSIAEGFEGTVYRQIVWSNYEYDLYKKIEQGQSLATYADIAKVYYDNSLKYALKKLKFKEEEQNAAVTVPHFYYDFYVYKYAVGQLVANIIFARYKKQGVKVLEDYIKNFLSVGNSLTPLETIKNIGIDLEDPQVINEGFENAKENLKELKTLAKKIFKV